MFVTTNRIRSGLGLALAAELKPRGKDQESFGAQVSSPLPHPGSSPGLEELTPKSHQLWGRSWAGSAVGGPGLGQDQAVMRTCSQHPPHGSPPHPAPGMGHRPYARAWLVPIPSSSMVLVHILLPSWASVSPLMDIKLCRELLTPQPQALYNAAATGTAAHPAQQERKHQPLPGLLRSCCCASLVERESLPWDERRGQGEPPAPR